MSCSWVLKPKFFVFVPLLVILLIAVACGAEEATPTPQPTATPQPILAPEDIKSLVSEAVKAAIPPPAEVVSAAEIQKIVKAAIPATPTPAPTATPAPTPDPRALVVAARYGGILTMTITGAPATVDPHRSGNPAGAVAVPSYNGVVTFDPINPSEIIGNLAKSWEVSANGLEWTFAIHQNVKFMDGSDLTADDIAFNINRMIEPDAPRPKIATLKRWVDRAEVVDQHTARVFTKRPGPPWLLYLAMPYSAVMPKQLLDKGVDFNLFENVVGSGPFKNVDHIEGVSWEFERNPDYWKEGFPYADGLKNFAIPDPGTVIAAFKSGRLLMCFWACASLKIDDILRLEKDDEFSRKHDIWPMEGTSGRSITMNTRIKPFDDPRVRRALFLAAHRQPLAEALGFGFFPIGYMIDPGSRWALPMEEILSTPGIRELNGKNHPDDIAEAKRLLAEAGFPGGKGITGAVIAPNVGSLPDFVILYTQQLKETLGIDLEPRPIPIPDWITKASKGDFFMTFQGVSSIIPDPDDRFRSLYSDHPQNWAGLIDPKLEELFAKQTAETDFEKRKAIVFEMQRLVLAGAPGHLQFMWKTDFQVTNKRVKTLAGHYVLPFRPHTGPFRHEHEWLELE